MSPRGRRQRDDAETLRGRNAVVDMKPESTAAARRLLAMEEVVK